MTLVFHRWLRGFPLNIVRNREYFSLYPAKRARTQRTNPAVPTRVYMGHANKYMYGFRIIIAIIVITNTYVPPDTSMTYYPSFCLLSLQHL